ncbi:helix-turn-helix domain-containing protein [Mucilaginibacter litoreus]|uniref:Helix-turn-helix domain-containing protein n=1 Tax=Mucilaginibacter litoreus TaxID=1048221 RepID=A0ABW3AXL6_9SPHI
MPINFFKDIAYPHDDHVIKIAPPDSVKEFVEGYYLFNTGRLEKRALFFNDGYPVIAFMQSPDEKMKLSIEGTAKQLDNIWVCGGMLNNVYCESPASYGNLFVVRFYPLTFFKLFEVQHNCFEEDQVFNLSEIVGTGIKELNDGYYNSLSIDSRIEIISGFIAQKANSCSYPKLLTDLLNYIDRQDVFTVKDLQTKYATRLNYKWLERNFKAFTGLSPKNYFLIKRFLNAYLDLHSYTSKDLIQVAIDNGYYDDNHLIKDFKRFAGISPKKYFQEINKFN